MAFSSESSVKKLPHHEQLELCVTRAKYRQGRKLTAVRVFTVNDESKYLIVNGVSAIKISKELEVLCQRYGEVEFFNLLSDYPHEDYEEAYLVKYRVLKNARFAKRQLDGKSFYGQVLHVCYAPELETVGETREKLQDRRKSIAALTRYQQDPSALSHVQKRRVLPATATRYITQLRPDLKKENMDRLHHRVENSLVASSGAGHQEQDDGGGDLHDASHTSESCSRNTTVHETVDATSVGNADLKHISEKRTQTHSVTEKCENIVAKKNKRYIESCMTTKKKIRIFGNKSLLSYKQD